jgi:hypothetical protein
VTHNVTEGLAVASHAAVMLDGQFARFGSTAGLVALEFEREYRDLAAGRDGESSAAGA